MANNCLLIVADEFARHAMGCAGHPVVQTPHLDALAARGARFRHAYTNSPICVPARAAMHTGRYVHDIRCWDSAQPYRGQHQSWAHELRQQDADVVSVGKLHFRSATDDNGFAQEILPLHVKDGIGWAPGLLRRTTTSFPAAANLSKDVGRQETAYHRYDAAVTQRAIAWLSDRGSAADRPWAMTVSYVSPHFPLSAPGPWYDRYADAQVQPPRSYAGNWRDHPALAHTLQFFDYDRHFDDRSRIEAIRGYFGMVSFVDHQVGLLMAALRENGLGETTTILFVSDHGEMLGEHGIWTKQVMFEGSVGIPVIVAGPNIDGGVEVDTPVSLIDVYPTITEATGTEALQPELPGRSLVETAAAPAEPDRPVLSEYHDGGSITGSFMLRLGDWKLIHHEDYAPQLFNLRTDPAEQEDCATDPASGPVLETMQDALLDQVDPKAANAQAFADQAQALERLGGAAAVQAMAGFDFGFSPIEQ